VARASWGYGPRGKASRMTRSLNGQQRALRRYHELTNHSPAGVASSGHRLDWSIKPIPFKVYRELEPMPPPADTGRLCRLSNGVLRWRRYPTGEHYGFRAAACTGALYHIELYLATAERDDLPAGLYHYGAHDHALRRLRRDAIAIRPTASGPDRRRRVRGGVCGGRAGTAASAGALALPSRSRE